MTAETRLPAMERLLLALSNLRSYGIEAGIEEGEDPEAVMDEIQAALRAEHPDGTGCCLVAMRSDLSCFDVDGNLTRPLLLRQRGIAVKPATRLALGDYDLGVCELEGEEALLVFDAAPGEPGGGSSDSGPAVGRTSGSGAAA